MWKQLTVAASLSTMLGCATMFGSNPQPVVVNSNPSSAVVSVNNSPSGQTPTTIQLDRKQTYTIGVQKAGHANYEQMLTKSVDPMFFLNLLFLPGMLVDLATGQWQKFPDQFTAPLVPLTASRR